jgi:hypothetical protein
LKLLRFRLLPDGRIRLLIHLDETKVTGDGFPDPVWVYEVVWPKKPANVTATAYRDTIKQESKLLAQLELAERQDAFDEGTPLTGEGETL